MEWLHLGHIGGPFLKLDVIKRSNQQIGNVVFFCSGSDSYESHALLAAHNQKKSIEALCFFYHDQIVNDLKTMLIDMDLFLNPLDIKYKNHLTEITQQQVKQLVDMGKAVEINEQYPFSNNYGFLPPSFIAGICPECKHATSGFICETCGFTYRPEEMTGVHCRSEFKLTEMKRVSTLFLKMDKPQLQKALVASYVPKNSLELTQSFLAKNDYTRLTLPIKWGISASHERVYYSYGTFFSYYTALRESCVKALNLKTLPFTEDADVNTVVSFGFDNTLTFLVETLNQALSLGHKGFDCYLSNKFLTLNGDKFSTSRNHAIWVHKLPKNISIDLIRLFLLKVNADQDQSDFNLQEFVSFYNWIACIINAKIISKLKVPNFYLPRQEHNKHSSGLLRLWEQKKMDAIPSNYSGNKFYLDIISWLEGDVYESEYMEWLHGIAILCYPVMPVLSQRVWDFLGGTGVPSLENCNHFSSEPFSMSEIEQINISEIKVG
ncbi:class I tRNA ligase family protein [Fastidiosibacter lacustris]|uniref:class I tRNA ligase family protein n=1 Tax=Fastidiosibacter lacustris TaxID=2056695 RepID=UPI000E342DB8|nr:class I tRNA ligase family protein [Fastidiosibacter lacustris]